MDRRRFLIRVGGALIAVPAVLQLTACGGNGGGGGGNPDASTGASSFNISSTGSTHVHMITVVCVDLSSNGDVTYTSTVASGHTHDVTITVAQLGMIAGGTSVQIVTTSGGHMHTWTIAKPSGACG